MERRGADPTQEAGPRRRAGAPAVLAGLAALVLLAGCSSGLGLRPSDPGQVHPERRRAARAGAQGIGVLAQFDRWKGVPLQSDEFTAVLVEIENGSERPLRIRYDDFRLEAGGATSTPRDPRQIEGTAPVSGLARGGAGYLNRFSYSGFHLAPHHSALGRFHGAGHRHLGFGHGLGGFGHGLGGFGHGLHGFGHGLGFGGYGFGHGSYAYHGSFRRVELPTRDMLAAAVPEGTLEPGGRVEGYLFFPKLDDDTSEATLAATLEDVEGDRLDEVRLRFRTP